MTEKIVRLEKKSLKKVLGVFQLFSIGYGDVGSSIYYTLGATALFALGATPIAFALAGFVFICTALTYAEMASTFPEPGGSAAFSRHAFNDLISFVAGWGLLLDYIVTLAISAFTIPPYLSRVVQLFGISFTHTVFSHLTWSVFIVGILFLVNWIGIKSSGRLNVILALFTLITQGIIVILGLFFLLNLPYVISHLRVGVAHVSWSPSWLDFFKGCAMAMVAYTGIEAIAQLAAETKQPALAIPRSIKWTVFVVLSLYLGISMVGLSAVSPEELGTTYLSDPVAGIVAHFPIGGEWLAPWVGLAAALILLICANAGLIGCSRLIFAMGEYYQVPNIFYKIHPRFRTPHVALGVFAFLAMVVIVASRGKMLFLADIYNFGAQIAFFSAHMALLVLRIRSPKLARPYLVPFNIPIGKGRKIPITAVVGAIATLAVWLLVVFTKPQGRILGFSWMALGLLMYIYYRKRKQISPFASLQVETIQIPEYKKLSIKHILVAVRALGGTEALQTAFQLAKVHGAKVTVVYILEVPESLPLDAPLLWREQIGEAALKRAEAVSHEYQVHVELGLIRSRAIDQALLRLVKGGPFDLLVIGARSDEIQEGDSFAIQAEKVLKDSTCRVLFCRM